jgi:hypothetical protein
MRSMRLILWACLGLGLLWAGYWYVGSRQVKLGVEGWFAQQQAAGLVAENRGIAVAGFADRFDLTVTEPHLADPESGWGWRAPFAQVFAMTWKPWQLIAALPNSQEVDTPDGQKITLGSTRLMASLLSRPNFTLPLERAVLEAEAVTLTSDHGWSASADKVVLAAQNDPTRSNSLRLGAEISNLGLPALLASLPELGPKISTLHLDAKMGFTAPVTLTLAPTQVADLNLTSAQLTWGSLDLSAKGSITADANGYATGKFDLKVKNWRILPRLVVALGLVPPRNEETVARGLAFLAKLSPDPETLSLPVTFRDGMTLLGPLPIGPAPRLQG